MMAPFQVEKDLKSYFSRHGYTVEAVKEIYNAEDIRL